MLLRILFDTTKEQFCTVLYILPALSGPLLSELPPGLLARLPAGARPDAHPGHHRHALLPLGHRQSGDLRAGTFPGSHHQQPAPDSLQSTVVEAVGSGGRDLQSPLGPVLQPDPDGGVDPGQQEERYDERGDSRSCAVTRRLGVLINQKVRNCRYFYYGYLWWAASGCVEIVKVSLPVTEAWPSHSELTSNKRPTIDNQLSKLHARLSIQYYVEPGLLTHMRPARTAPASQGTRMAGSPLNRPGCSLGPAWL